MTKKTNGKPPMERKFNLAALKRLMSYMGAYKFRFIIVVICIFISSAAIVSSSLFLEVLIDDYITPLLSQTIPDFSGLAKAVLILMGVYIIGIFASWIYNRMMVSISQGVLKKIRDDMFEHMQTLPIKYFDTRTHGDIMSHYTNDTDTLRQMMAQGIPQILSSLMSITVVFFSMLSISIWLTLVVLLCLVIIFKFVGIVAGKSGKYFVAQQRAIGDLNGYIEEMINGQKVVKVFCHEEKAKEKFNLKNEELCKNATLANKYVNILMPMMMNMGHLLYIILAIVGGIMGIIGVTNISLSGVGVLSLGMIASFLNLSRSFINPISQVSQQFNAIIMALAGADRIFKLIDEKSEEDDGYVTLVNAKYDGDKLVETEERTELWAWKHPHEDGSVTYTELKGEVRFFDVDFGYTKEKTVLHDISLYAEPGQKIAFVGATGAGKTTITNLINRFYDINDGKIRYDGININKIKKSDLRRSLGVVLQDVNLFTGTVMDNLRYARPDATDEECIAAAKLANAHHFIELLPQGYDTVLVGGGASLSQGQRQLISIARAEVADPPVMILDEATSSIDTRTEAIVQQGMDSLMYGRTVFVIAHRLSTIQNSNVIMVLENGRIIERGSHDDLIAEHGKYYQLYTGAFEDNN